MHEPNDDQLFLGHLDTQIGEGLNIEREWAMEQICSHYRLAEEVIFKIK